MSATFYMELEVAVFVYKLMMIFNDGTMRDHLLQNLQYFYKFLVVFLFCKVNLK